MSNRVKMTRHVARRHCQHQPVPSKTIERVLKQIYASFKVDLFCQMFDICLQNQMTDQIYITPTLFFSLMYPAALGWSVRPETNATTTPSAPACSVQDDRAGLEADLRELQGRFILSNVRHFFTNFDERSDQLCDSLNDLRVCFSSTIQYCLQRTYSSNLLCINVINISSISR